MTEIKVFAKKRQKYSLTTNRIIKDFKIVKNSNLESKDITIKLNKITYKTKIELMI